MSSKLDYLSKYMDDGKGNGKEKHSKKKKKKKRKEKELRVIEHDLNPEVDLPPFALEGTHDADHPEDDDSIGPVVVESATEPMVVTSASQRRYDSEEDEDSQKQSRQRYDSSDDDKSQTRQRYDSDEDDDPHRQTSRTRYDSDDSHTQQSAHLRPKVSSKDESSALGKKRHRYDSSEDSDSDSRSDRMASGHKSGLQSGSRFKEAEQKIQKSRHKEAQATVDKYGMGETIYRDEKGKRTSRKEPVNTKRELTKSEQLALNMGRVQQQQVQTKAKQMEEMSNTAFARHAGDSNLEESLKATLREGDPMLQYSTHKKRKLKKSKGNSEDSGSKRLYKGPPAKPNRFNIKPGFRWDGIDRGNGWESKLLAQTYSKRHKAEESYRWSTADM